MSRLSALLAQAASVHKDVAPAPTSSAKTRLSFTKEQSDFLACNDDKIMLTALAGTGKTTTLMEYARRRPEQKWNLLAFNRSVVDAWSAKAPPNVKVQTVHQLAFARFGKHLAHKMVSDDISLLHIVQAQHSSFSLHQQKLVARTMEIYLNTALSLDAIQPSSEHLDRANMSLCQLKGVVRELWEEMLNPHSPCAITHDVYLKRLAQSDFDWEGRWMLDEAQDWNTAFLTAFRQQAHRRILCGDPYQRLYGWRHAVSHWGKESNETQFWLTKSMRQGKGAEHIVNRWLRNQGASVVWSGHDAFPCLVSHTEEVSSSIASFNPNMVLAYDHETLARFVRDHGDFPTMTIHASKGLEFDRVWVCDDACKHRGAWDDADALMYVASTRARHALRVPSSVHPFNSPSFKGGLHSEPSQIQDVQIQDMLGSSHKPFEEDDFFADLS